MVDVVVVGGGFAGVLMARKLHATLISARPDFVFLPRLPELLRDDAPQSTVSLGDAVIVDEVLSVDTAAHEVLCKDRKVSYDVLVVATGARPRTGVAGVDTYAHLLYSPEDATRIRDAAGSARRIVIVGGGPTGVELAAEFAGRKEVTLLEGANEILRGYSDKARKRALAWLSEHGVTVRKGVKVQRVNARSVVADERVPYDLLIWAAGVEPVQLKGLPSSSQGIPVDEHLRVKGVEDVYCVGDAAASGTPRTAQAAIAEARLAIHNIRHPRNPRKLDFTSKGMFLVLHDTVIIDGPLVAEGRWVSWLRDAYYSHQLRRYGR